MTPEHHHPRRRDRSKDEEWIRDLLHEGDAAVLAMVREGRPVCLPRIFVFHEGRNAVYVHSAHGGEVGSVLEKDGTLSSAPMTLTVFEMGRLLPADEAGEFSVEYRSVVASGTGALVADPAEAEEALVLLMEKYAPHLKVGTDYQPVAAEEVERTAVLRVDIEGWSGKEKKEAPDFPGAYRLEDVRGR